MDVAGAPAQVAVHAKPGDIVVVEGAGKAGLLCLAEAKRRVAPTGKVVCMEYSAEQCEVVKKLGIADVVINANGQKPLEAYDKYMEAMNGQLADFAVNTVSVPNTELSIIMVTKNEGMIYFFSMSTDFVKASLGAEGIKKYVPMLIGDGYYPGHAEIAFNIVRQNEKVRKYFEERYCK
jgi:L-erythro-3,5-diaminohexanoate dehydrogenase